MDAKHGPDADKHYISGSKQNFSETVIDLFQQNSFDDLPNIVLKSNVLREYAADRLMTVLNNKSGSSSKIQNERLLSLVLLQVQKCNTKKAQDILVDVPQNDLKSILLENWELLFEHANSSGRTRPSSFSELSILMMAVYPDVLSDLLVTLTNARKVMTLHKLLRVSLIVLMNYWTVFSCILCLTYLIVSYTLLIQS